MKTVETYEYDDKGRMTKKTVETIQDQAEPMKVYPSPQPLVACTCHKYRNWNSIMPPPPCPMHDYYFNRTTPWDRIRVTWNTNGASIT